MHIMCGFYLINCLVENTHILSILKVYNKYMYVYVSLAYTINKLR